MDERAKRAIDRLLKLEGGYVNDSADPGGETNFGICKRSYPNVDIKHLTREEAAEIYFHDWWEKYGYAKINSDAIAFRLLDQAVVSGPHSAHMVLQRAVNEMMGYPYLLADGVLGPKSVAAVNDLTPTSTSRRLLITAHQREAISFFRSLNKRRFLQGWINRVMTPVDEV